ncbi:pilus assembly PilX family protein [Methylolobus aquaticus]|nr:pilus assembly protein PilZ [Methylolobus aquaticus]
MNATDRLGLNATTQSGAALITGLLMLLVMTLIGVTAMRVTNLEEKMAGNLRDRNVAFQAAETALRAGERCVSAANGLQDCVAGLYSENDYNRDATANDPLPLLDASFWDSSGVMTYSGANLAAVSVGPRYVVEEIPYLCAPVSLEVAPVERCYFRITGRGIGGTTSAEVILQSVHKR